MSEKKHEHKHMDKEPIISEENLHKLLKSILPLIEKAKQEVEEVQDHAAEHHGEGGIHDIMLQPAMLPVRSLDIFEDEDYEQGNRFNAFRDDLGGGAGLIKIIRLNPDDAHVKIAACVEKMNKIIVAERLKDVRLAYELVKTFSENNDGVYQTKAIKLLNKLAENCNTDKERYAFVKAKKAVLSGESDQIDAAAFRIQNIFASNVPQNNVRII